jgi:hypothetical protein
MKLLAYQDEIGTVIIAEPNYAEGFDVESIKHSYPSDSIVVESDSIPHSIFCPAYKIENSMVTVDLPKAKPIAHGIRRKRREEYFAPRIEILQRDSIGIPSGQNEKTAAEARAENAAFKLQDDAIQISIDNATSEAEILAALGM